jgi:predicted amidohydrolase YtcJ
LNNAYTAFDEEIKGSLKPGKLADITVLTRDIVTIPEDEIRSAMVAYTIVGGKVVYQRR